MHADKKGYGLPSFIDGYLSVQRRIVLYIAIDKRDEYYASYNLHSI